MVWSSEKASGSENGSGSVLVDLTFSEGSGSPPPPPDTTLEELTTWVIVVIGICLLVFFVVGLVWVADSESQPHARKRQGWLVWNGDWYKVQNRNVKVLQRESQESASVALPVISTRKPNEERRPLICAKAPR